MGKKLGSGLATLALAGAGFGVYTCGQMRHNTKTEKYNRSIAALEESMDEYGKKVQHVVGDGDADENVAHVFKWGIDSPQGRAIVHHFACENPARVWKHMPNCDGTDTYLTSPPAFKAGNLSGGSPYVLDNLWGIDQ
ncbi:hypothetical protein GOV11_03855 [Candidatus Woesearchaeota archaeon]|nr:hypothetical protein [Candidatus Woesearchaeota archaeon]